MKLELPVAILLLAGGGYLWTAQGGQLPFFNKTVEKTEVTAPHSHSIAPKSHQYSGASELGHVSFKKPNTSTKNNDVSPNGAAQLLQNAARNVMNSPPIQSSTELTVDLFEQQFSAKGRYYQRGQSSGRARLEIEYPIDENSSGRLTQVCNGRFYFCTHQTPEKKSLQYFELQPVVQADKFSIGAQPSAWMTTGGLSSLLEHLAHSFAFEPPQKTEIGGISAVRLRGSWKKSALKNLFQDQVEASWLEPSIRWDRLPSHLPHAVEVYLGTDEFLPLFPYKISFLQVKTLDETEPATASIPTKRSTRPIVTLRFSDVAKVNSLPDNYFAISSEDADPVINHTDDYAARMDELTELHRTAQSESTSENR